MTVNEAGEYAFASQEVRDEYLVCHSADLLDRVWDDLGSFSDALGDSQHRLAVLDCASHCQGLVLRLLAQQHERDVVVRTGQLAELAQADPDLWVHRFWNLYSVLNEVLPYLSPDPDTLARALHYIALASANDLAAGREYRAVRVLSGRSADYARDLLRAFLTSSDSPTVSYVPEVLVGLASFDLPQALRIGEELTGSDALLVRRAGIATLGCLPYGDSGSPHLASALQRLTALLGEPDPETDFVLLRAVADLLDLAPQLAPHIPVLTLRGDARARHQGAYVLASRQDHSAQPWYEATLLALATCDPNERRTLAYLDIALKQVVQTNASVAMEFLSAFLPRILDPADDETHTWRTPTEAMLHLMRDQRATVEATLTRWLASSDLELHRAAAFLLQFAADPPGNSEAIALGLNSETFDMLPEALALSVLKRSLGRLGAHPTAALEVLVSVLRSDPIPIEGSELVEDLVREVLLYNYPGQMGQRVRDTLDREDLPPAAVDLLQRALASSESYYQDLRALPKLPELRAPPARRLLLHMERLELQKRILEQAQRSSVLLSLARQVPIKFGASYTIEMEPGVFTQPGTMNSVSHEVEFPRGEFIDPVGQQYRRLSWIRDGLAEEATEEAEEPDSTKANP